MHDMCEYVRAILHRAYLDITGQILGTRQQVGIVANSQFSILINEYE